MFWSQKRFSYSLNLDLKQKCHFFGSRLKVTEGYVIGGVNTTSALSLPAGFVYLQQTAAKTNSNTVNNTFVLLVGKVKHLLRAKHNAGMLWKLGREVKIFNPLFFPLFRIQRDFFLQLCKFLYIGYKVHPAIWKRSEDCACLCLCQAEWFHQGSMEEGDKTSFSGEVHTKLSKRAIQERTSFMFLHKT